MLASVNIAMGSSDALMLAAPRIDCSDKSAPPPQLSAAHWTPPQLENLNDAGAKCLALERSDFIACVGSSDPEKA
jgi:hypothetical protein